MRTSIARVTFILVATLAACLAADVQAGFAGSDLFLPMAGRQVGVFPSNWYTTVWIYNPGPAAATARIYFLERGTANPTPPSVDVLVPAGDTAKIENVVESLFQRQAYGALRVTSDAQQLVVTSRVYSRAVGAGDADSLGQDFAGVPAAFAIGLGEKSQVLGVHQTAPAADSEVRYNFGFVETTGHSATVRVRAFDATGADLGSKDFQVREWSQRQVAFKDHFPAVSTENARLEIEVIAGSGRVIAYGSAIANGSQDPTTFEMTYATEDIHTDATLVGDGTQGSPLGLADGAVTIAKLATANTPSASALGAGDSLAAAPVRVLAAVGGGLKWENAGTGDITAVTASTPAIGGDCHVGHGVR